jgi:hypothetical protein
VCVWRARCAGWSYRISQTTTWRNHCFIFVSCVVASPYSTVMTNFFKTVAAVASSAATALQVAMPGLMVGLGTFHMILQSGHHLMTPSMVHVTKLTPGSDKPSSAWGVWLKTPIDDTQYGPITAAMVNVTNLTTPGSDNPTPCSSSSSTTSS